MVVEVEVGGGDIELLEREAGCKEELYGGV